MRILLLLAMALTSISFSIEKERNEPSVITTEINTTIEEEVVDSSVSIPIVVVETTTSTTTTLPETTTSTTTTTIALPEGDCSEWYQTALNAGWEYDQLNKLGRIMWKESNCIHDIANKTYSYGLVQIEWSAHYRWLDSEFGITEREALFDPYTNLLVAKWLFDYATVNYGCGWQPWYMSGDWC